MNYDIKMLDYALCYFPAFLLGFCTCLAIVALAPVCSRVIQRLQKPKIFHFR